MKKKITISLLLSLTLLFFYASDYAFTKSSQPPAEMTGAPGEKTCARTGCHTNSSGGNGNVSLLFDSGNNFYEPGSTYTIQVEVDDPDINKIRYGFEVTALDGNNNKAGDFVVTNTVNTTTQTSNSRQYISHKNANSTNQWQFEWTAPSSDVGKITFYFAGNAANGSGANNDHIYTNTAEISTLVSSVVNQSIPGFEIAPTIVTDRLTLNFHLQQSGNVNVTLYSIDGKQKGTLINRNLLPGKYVQDLRIPAGTSPGVYIVQGSVQDQIFSRKIIIR